LRRPILPFALQAVALAPLLLAPDPSQSLGGYFIAAPFLIIVMTALNLPVIASAFQRFRQPIGTRRNHALEHATIIVLETSTKKRLAGRAGDTGFRLYGAVTEQQIRDAFEKVCRTIRAGEPLVYVSPRCGSNIVTTLAGATGLLLLMTSASLILALPYAVRVGGFASSVLLFFSLRRRLGNAIQRRFFMATDFVDVSLRGIRREPTDPTRRGPVHFVKTTVRLPVVSGEQQTTSACKHDDASVAGSGR